MLKPRKYYKQQRESEGKGAAWEWDKMAVKRITNVFKVFYLLKLVIVELIIFLLAFYAINLFYRFALGEEHKRRFDHLVSYFDDNLSFFGRDITFLLGFYVSLVAKRWWDQYRLLPWPDNLAMTLSGLVVTDTEESQELRRNIVRYALLSYVLCIRRFSSNLMKHFPTLKTLINLGLVKIEEVPKLNLAEDSSDELLASNWWLPMAWAVNLVKFAKIKGHIPSDQKEVIREILKFRTNLESVESHVHVSIPLVYKVVVTAAIYLYFALSLLGSQTIANKEEGYDYYFPLFIVLKLIIFIGWLKVAQSIEKPFDDDDADFEMFSLLTRHLRTTSMILNEFDHLPPSNDFYAKDPPKIPEEDELNVTKLPPVPQNHPKNLVQKFPNGRINKGNLVFPSSSTQNNSLTQILDQNLNELSL